MPLMPVTENLAIDTSEKKWVCRGCGGGLGDARRNYKEGCLVRARDPRFVHHAVIEGAHTFAPDPDWIRVVEFVCPQCGRLVETEYLPPGHPITFDLELDVDRFVREFGEGH